MGGVTCRGIAIWNGSSWAALGPPSSGGTVYGIERWTDHDGYLYVTGDFTNWDGNANSDYAAYWDGAAWQNVVELIPVADDIIFGVYQRGEAPGGEVPYVFVASQAKTIGRYSSIHYPLGVTFEDSVNDIGWDEQHSSGYQRFVKHIPSVGLAITVGTFTGYFQPTPILLRIAKMADKDDANDMEIKPFAGSGASGGGLNGTGRTIEYIDGQFWIGGDFTVAGAQTVNDGLSIIDADQSTWIGQPADLPGSGSNVHAIAKGKARAARDDVFVGYDATGTVVTGWKGTVVNLGTVEVYPVILIKFVSGTAVQLLNITNVTTGATINFSTQYDMAVGESLTIDLRQGKRSAVSSLSGDIWPFTPTSDISNFVLLVGDNVVVINGAGISAAVMDIAVLHLPTYLSSD
jgi:hypothetical protein